MVDGKKVRVEGGKVDSPSSDLLCELWVAVACFHVSSCPEHVPDSTGSHVRRMKPAHP